MKSVGAFEAKTHFSEILANLPNSGPIVITKNGRPVATIYPIDAQPSAKLTSAKERLKALRKRILKEHPIQDERSLREMIEEGRR